MSRGQRDTRARILQTTWRLLESNRGQGVRLEDIAQAVGVSRRAVYLHFDSRADLFVATVRYVDEVLRMPERIQQACEAGNGVLGIEGLVSVWGNYIPEIYGLAKALLAQRETDEAAAAAWADRMEALYQACLRIVRQLADDGQLAPEWTVETAAQFFFALSSIEIWERLVIERGWSPVQFEEWLADSARRLVLAEPSQTGAGLAP